MILPNPPANTTFLTSSFCVEVSLDGMSGFQSRMKKEASISNGKSLLQQRLLEFPSSSRQGSLLGVIRHEHPFH